VRCGRCGNDNAETNRFCGMCGAALVPPSRPLAPGVGGPSAALNNPSTPRPAYPSQPAPARGAAPAPAAASAGGAVERGPVLSSFDVARSDETEREPIISGPSFLGLNKPAARRSRLRDDSHAGGPDHLRSSGNVDYLLEDDEEPKSGWGKLLLILVALVLAAGFGYLRWKQGGFDWLKAGDKKPAATQVAPDAGQSSGDNGSSATTAAPAGATAGGAPTAPTPATAGSATNSTQNSSAPSQVPAAQTTPSQASPQQGSSQQSSPPQATAPATPSTDDGPQSQSPAAATQVTGSPNQPRATAPADTAPQSTGDSAEQSSDSGEELPPTAKAAAHRAATARAAASKPSPAKPIDTVAEAERYVYGSGGVRQDCDRGLRMLKAAGQSDAKAMISLGSLYSTGTCAPRDLPTAYRWFALALHKQPDNQALQDDLQKLWSQMTPPERQLAIKLSK
jgi:hypothetical protein